MMLKTLLLISLFSLIEPHVYKPVGGPPCPRLPLVEHGKYKLIRKNQVRVICDPSYIYIDPIQPLSEATVIYCKNGNWSNPAPRCSLPSDNCEPPAAVEHGKISGFPPFTVGSTIQYYCEENYILVGPVIRTCQRRIYEWTDHDPLCLKNDLAGLAGRLDDQVRKMDGIFTGILVFKQRNSDHLRQALFIVEILNPINEFLPQDVCPSVTDLLEIYGKYSTNGFGIISQSMNKYGVGLFLGASMFDHSCQPNAAFAFDGTTMLISALEDIPQLDTSNVFISCIDILASTEERQRILKDAYCFDCLCPRCEDTEKDLITNSILCPNENCTHPTVYKNGSFKCLKCGPIKFEIEIIKISQLIALTEKYKKFLKEIVELVEKKKYEDIYKTGVLCIQEGKAIFHSLNVHYVRVLNETFRAAVILSKHRDLCDLRKELLVPFRYYYGKCCPQALGAILVHIGCALFFTQNIAEAIKVFREAMDVLLITYSKNSEVYKFCQIHLNLCEMMSKFEHMLSG